MNVFQNKDKDRDKENYLVFPICLNVSSLVDIRL